MKSPRNLAIRFLFVFILFITLFTNTTSADINDEEIIPNNVFKATTLDFSNRSTISSNPSSILFQTIGLITGGLDVAAIRVKKDGKMDFNYNLTVEPTLDSLLCQSLSLKVIKDNEFIYQNKLTQLDLNQFLTDQVDDYVFILSLPTSVENLSNLNCQFDFVFTTTKSGLPKTVGFTDEERVVNFISTGSW